MTICTTRPKNASTTRGAILGAARTRLLRESYDTVGLRDVAGDVGVDVALVSRYFGGKEGLFQAVLADCGCDRKISVPDGDLAEQLADAMLEKTPGEANRDRLLILLRSASSPRAADIVRRSFSANVLEPLSDALDGDDRDMRAGLAMACVMGSALLGEILAVDPLTPEDRIKVRARIVPMLREALKS